MAFNPFESFRKNGKAIFAVLAIVCMFTFVLSSGIGGGGDIFDWFARQLGGKDNRSVVLGEIGGREYTAESLSELRKKRRAANIYLMEAVNTSDQRMKEQIISELSSKSKDFTDQQVPQLLKMALDDRMRPEFKQQILSMLYQTFFRLNPKDRTPEYTILDRFIKLSESQRRTEPFRRGMRSNFLEMNPPNVTDADALQFAMYLREADKMGIKFTDENIQDLINDLTIAGFDRNSAAGIDNALRKDLKLTPAAVFEAVGDEFRVQAAIKILLGAAEYDNLDCIPAAMTPYEFFEFYKDNFEQVVDQVVAVPVEKFLSEVKETPTAKELADLFDKYRKDEFDPRRPTPGFKQPLKIKLEYVGIESKLPNYQSNSPAVKQLGAASAIAAGLAASTGRDWFTGAMTAAAPVMAESWLVQDMAALAKPFHPFEWQESGYSFPRLADSSIYNPYPSAALVGQLAVLGNPVTGLPSAIEGYRNMARAIEIRDRARVGVQLTLAPMGFQPAMPLSTIAPVSVIGPVAANSPIAPSGVYYAREAERNNSVSRPQRLARADLGSLQDKLLEIRRKAEPKPDLTDPTALKKKTAPKVDPKVVADANAEARKLIDEWIKARLPGVQTGKSEQLHDKFTIVDDPGLKILAEKVKGEQFPFQAFDRDFFRTSGPEPTKETVAAALYDPKVFPFGFLPSAQTFSAPVYMAWKIEEEPAKAYANFDAAPKEMQDKVVRAWKFQKARVLAKEAADKLGSELAELGKKELRDADNILGFDKGMRDLCQKGPFFPIIERITLSKLHRVKDPGLNMQQRQAMPDYQPMQIEVKEIPYPQQRMAEQLLEVRNKPLGEVVIVPDEPIANYYVSVMVQKNIPTIPQFYNLVFKTANPPAKEQADALYSRYSRREAFMNFIKDARDRVRAELKYKETDALKKQEERGSREEPFE